MRLNLRWITVGALLALLLSIATFWTLAYGLKGLTGLTIGIALALAGISILRRDSRRRHQARQATINGGGPP